MLTTSKDLLFIVIAFCVLWLTIFLSLILYYLIVILKRGKEVVDLFREKTQKMLEVIDIFKKKVEPTMACISTVVEGVKQVTDYVQKKKTRKKKKK